MRSIAIALATVFAFSLAAGPVLACGFGKSAKNTTTVEAPSTPLPTQTASTKSGS